MMVVSDAGRGTCFSHTKNTQSTDYTDSFPCNLWINIYFFQAGNVLRAGFSFFRPRAQSACMSV